MLKRKSHVRQSIVSTILCAAARACLHLFMELHEGTGRKQVIRWMQRGYTDPMLNVIGRMVSGDHHVALTRPEHDDALPALRGMVRC
jgi:hypothetical protein